MKWMQGTALLLVMVLSSAAGGAGAAGGQADKCAADKDAAGVLQAAMPAGGMQSLAEAIRYPPQALRDGLEGEVRLHVDVDAAGRVGEVSVLQPLRADLDSAAVRAVRAVAWTPARGADGALPCAVVVPIRFRLEQKSKP